MLRIAPNKYGVESSRTYFLYALDIFWAAMEIKAILTIILFRINDL